MPVLPEGRVLRSALRPVPAAGRRRSALFECREVFCTWKGGEGSEQTTYEGYRLAHRPHDVLPYAGCSPDQRLGGGR